MFSGGGSPIKLRVKVVPGSSRDCLAGWLGETLKIRVSAPPERGKANQAVEQLLADSLGVPRRSVRVVTGMSSTRKTIEFVGLGEAEVLKKLADLVA